MIVCGLTVGNIGGSVTIRHSGDLAGDADLAGSSNDAACWG